MGVLVLVACAASSSAQEMKPMKYHGAWFAVEHVKYHAGQMMKAAEIIRKYFEPAAKEAGTPMPELVLQYATGPWDMTYVWRLKEGPAALEWHFSPDDIKWMAALNKVAGGPEKAQKVLSDYEGTVAKASRELAHSWGDMNMKGMEKQ